jgi:sugar lactone lactonase YvrE
MRRLAVEVLEDRTLLNATLQVITVPSVPAPSVSAAAGSSNNASVSADGRYVAYESTATNLVANQASGPITSNVFLFDRSTQATTLVSHDAGSATTGGNADSFSAVLSGNGRYVYYLSRATDLVSGESNPVGSEDLYVYDTVAGTNRLVSSRAGNPSQAANGNTGLLNSALNTGAPFTVSADGTRVAYVSAADDLVSGMTGLSGAAHPNVFLTDISTPTPTTWLISAQAGSSSAGVGGWSPALSGDGKALAFVSDGTNLVPGQAEQTPPPGTADYSAVFLADVSTSSPATTLVSRQYGTTATVAGAASDTPVINQDGSVVAFRSDAADLVSGQVAGNPPGISSGNVFVYERTSDSMVLVSAEPGQPTVAAGGTPFTPDSAGPLPLAISAVGQSVVYQSQAATLVGASVPPGNPPPTNIFLWTPSGNSLVSGAGGSPSTPADGSSSALVLSADGSTVAFESTATDIVPQQATTGSARNVFTSAVVAGQAQPPVLVSSAAGSSFVAANADSAGGARGTSGGPSLYPGSIGLSTDGSVLVFQSSATNLSTGIYKADGDTDVFASDGSTGGLTLVSQSAAPVVTAGGNSYLASVSADDRYTAFVSDAFNLVANQQNNHFGLNVFLRDNTAGTIALVNHLPPPGSPAATGDSGIPRPPFTPDPAAGRLVPPPPPAAVMPVVSGDGSTVVFVSNDHNLVVGQQSPGSFNNVFRYNVADGSVTLVSHLPDQGTVSGPYDSNSPVVSFGGEFIALVSNGGLYLYDASSPQTLTQIAASGSSPSISDDGRYVAYVSGGNAFLYDRLAGTSTLISHDAGSPTGDLLALSAPPAPVTAAGPFAMTATVQNPFGKTDTTFDGTVTLAVGPGSPAGTELNGKVIVPAVNGVASFTGLMLTQAGTGYTVTASAGGVTSALTPAFQVVPAAASQLVFVTAPSLSLALPPLRPPISPTVAVAIEDPFGNVVNSSAGVTVALGNNPTGAALLGATMVAAVNGVATFNGLALNRAGTYTLKATSTGLPAVTSPSCTVTGTVAAVEIATFAGNGTGAFGGDGGPANAAELSGPLAAAVDAAGDVFIADTDNFSVREVSPSGTITTVAGNGAAGFRGDGGPATAAELYRPGGLALDAAGNLYIADTDNQRVREVLAINGVITPQSTITTVAGNGTAGFGGDGGPATAAEFNYPGGLAVDAAGDLYIGDVNGQRVRKVSPSGTITTITGNGTYSFGGDGGPASAAKIAAPFAVAVDAAGDLYIADAGNNRVREVLAVNGVVTPQSTIITVAGTGSTTFGGDGGPATAAALDAPTGVAVDAAGNLLIVDSSDGRVREVGAVNGAVTPQSIITTTAGNGTFGFGGDGGPATAAALAAPWGIAVDAAGDIYVTDRANDRVREVSSGATKLAILTQLPKTLTAGSQFSMGVAVEDGGGSTVSGYNGPVHVELATQSSAVTAVTSLATVTAVNGIATFNLSLTSATVNNTLLFSAANGPRFASSAFDVTSSTAAVLVFGQQPTNAVVGQPILPAVTVQVLDRYGNLVPGYSSAITLAPTTGPAGAVLSGATATPSQGVASFTGLNSNQAGTYVLSASSGSLQSAPSMSFSVTPVEALVAITTVAGNDPSAPLDNPSGVAVDAAGNLFIADTFDQRVLEVSPSGIVTTVVGPAAGLNYPQGVAVDAAGDLYIADTNNHRVRRVSPSGVITTVAGNGTYGFSGDGGPATAAQLFYPSGVAVDAAGDLYIADVDNSRIREVWPSGVITTVAGNGTIGFGGDGGPATAAELNDPVGVAVDAAGNLYIADNNNDRVREVQTIKGAITPQSAITTVAGGGSLGLGDGGPATAAEVFPTGVAVDAAGNLYIADNGSARVREVAPSGTIITVAGNGTYGFGGDGGPATAAEFEHPTGVAVTAAGNLYINDQGNARVRKVINPARQLVVTAPPPDSVQAGTPFTVAVTVEDASGNAVSGYVGYVTLALGSGSPPGAMLTEPPALVNANNGVATFQVTLNTPGSGYTLRAAVAGLTGATTAPFNVTGSAATRLALTSLPSPVTAGVPFSVQFTAQDAAGQIDPAFTGPVTVALGPGSPAGVTLQGPTLTVNASRGVATFSNLTVSQPGKGFTLSASAAGSGLYGASTLPFNVGAANASRLVLSQPARARAGNPFTFLVTAQDSSGNIATGFNGRVTVNLGQNPSGAGLSGLTTVSAVNGVATFSLGLSKPGTGYTLTATAAGLPQMATAPFAVAPGPELLALGVPAAVTAGAPFAVTVTAEDASGNPDPSFAGSITLAIGPGSLTDTFLGTVAGGSTIVTAVNGTATFPGLLMDAAGSYTLTATTAGLTGGFSSAFAVSPGPAARLAVTPPAAAVAGGSFPVTVAVLDGLGNLVPTFNGVLSIGLGSNPTGATLGGATTVSAVKGEAAFTLTLDRSGAGFTLVASDPTQVLPSATSLPFAVDGVTATQLGVAVPGFAVADAPFPVTVTALDSSGNPVLSFNGPVTLALDPSSPAGATLGGTLTAQAINGVATFPGLILANPGTGYALVASASAVTLAGAASHPLAVLLGGDVPSSDPVIDANGNAVAYVSAAGNLVDGPTATGFTNVLIYSVATNSSALVSGTPAGPANDNSDSPAIDADGGFVAYRSDATNLVPQQDGTAANVFLYGGGATALVSAVSGSSHTGAGSSFAPAIDGDGSKVVYLSRAADLVPNEAPGQTVNVYLYGAPLAESFLVSGRFGSATLPSNGDAFNALISRDSFPLLSSAATDLVRGVGAFSNGYRNTLISTSLALAGILHLGTGPRALVGTFQVDSAFAGQFRPPTYSLTGAGPDDASFQIPGGGSHLLTAATISRLSYTIQVRTNVGLGPIYGLDFLTIPVGPYVPPPPPPPPHTPVGVQLVSRVTGTRRKKRKRLAAQVAFADGLTEVLVSPFQQPAFRNVQVTILAPASEVIFTARKGKKKVTVTEHV